MMRSFALLFAFCGFLFSAICSYAEEVRFTCGAGTGIDQSFENANGPARFGFDHSPGQIIFVVGEIPDILFDYQDGDIRSVKSGIVPPTVSMSSMGSSIRFEVKSQNGDSTTYVVMKDGDRVTYVALIAGTRSKLRPHLALIKGDCR
jgi:hypothetical protein